MLSLKGIYSNGQIKLIEPIPESIDDFNVIITFVEEIKKRSNSIRMDENIFWQILSLLDFDKNDNEEVLKPCINYLSEFDSTEIFIFEDILSEKLHLLDTYEHAKAFGYEDKEYFSADSFLYARCYVVTKGKIYYEDILSHPEKMSNEETFESLLYISEKAYKFKTGKEFDYLPKYIYETFSNKKGWNNQFLSIEELIVKTNAST